MRSASTLLLLGAMLGLSPRGAFAGEEASGSVAATLAAPAPPVPAAKRLTLGAGRLNVTLTAEASLSADRAMKPLSFAPDISYGATSRLTLSVIQSGAAVNGFRGGAGAGVCLTGKDDGCPQAYRNVGLEGLFSLAEGSVAAAANLGVHLQPVSDPTVVKLKVGAKSRASAGPISVTFNPSLFITTNERQTQPDSLWLPVAIAVKPAPSFTTGLGTGVKIPDLGRAGQSYQVPIGVFAQAQLARPFLVGASFVFGNVVGAVGTHAGLDGRFLQLWASYTL